MDTSRLSIKCSTTSATNAAQSESNSTTESLGPSTMRADQSESIDTKVWVNDTTFILKHEIEFKWVFNC